MGRLGGGVLGLCELFGEGCYLLFEWLLGRLWAERAGLLRPASHLREVGHLLFGGWTLFPLLLILQLGLSWWEVVLLIELLVWIRGWGGKHKLSERLVTILLSEYFVVLGQRGSFGSMSFAR